MIAIARSMRCRPSEVYEEDEVDVALWLLWDEVEASIVERKRREAERKAQSGVRYRGPR